MKAYPLNSFPGLRCQVTTLGKLFTHVPLLSSGLIWLQCKTRKVLVTADYMVYVAYLLRPLYHNTMVANSLPA